MNIDDVKQVLSKQQLPQTTVQLIIADLKQQEALKKEERAAEAGHKSKNQFVVILNDPKNELAGKDFSAYVVQIPEDQPIDSTLQKIYTSAYDHNAGTRSGRKNPIRTVSEALEFVKRKFFKQNNLLVKTKEPVLVIKTDGQIPTVANANSTTSNP